MNKTSIEWVKNPNGTQGYTWNPITGCLEGCEYCYARRLANGRLKSRYLANSNLATMPMSEIWDKKLKYTDIYKAVADPFYPRFWPERLEDPLKVAQPCGIFTCDMGELFGDWIPYEWQEAVFNVIKIAQQHRFYLLTKQPQNLIKFSPFPGNCRVGVTATNQEQYRSALAGLAVIEAKVKYISFEPLLEYIATNPPYDLEGLNWVIIGACTGTKLELLELAAKLRKGGPPLEMALMPYGKKWTLQPKIEWVQEIVEAADKAGVKVFLKDNLMPLFEAEGITKRADWTGIRQEMPRQRE